MFEDIFSYDAPTLVQFIVDGLAVGLIYGLIALGFTTIYNSSGIMNFAQGAFVMLGGMVTYAFFSDAGFPLVAAVFMALLIVTGSGVVTYYAVVTPLQMRATSYSIMIALFGVHLLMENIALRTISSTGVGFKSFTPGGPIDIFDVHISRQTFWILGGTVALMAALQFFFIKTSLGRAWRGAAADPTAARLMGIPVNRIVMYSFATSAAIGAIAGILITPAQFTSFSVGLPFAVKGFAAAMIGGFGNIYGAIVGGLIIGLVEALGVAYWDAGYKDAITFVVLYLILIAKPSGLFGSLVEEEH